MIKLNVTDGLSNGWSLSSYNINTTSYTIDTVPFNGQPHEFTITYTASAAVRNVSVTMISHTGPVILSGNKLIHNSERLQNPENGSAVIQIAITPTSNEYPSVYTVTVNFTAPSGGGDTEVPIDILP